MFQPRLVGILTAVGLVLQEWPYFLVLAAVLWWNCLVPAMNVFDALYNALVARPRSLPRLTAAPGPRRFAQGEGGTIMLVVALALLWNRIALAWAFEGLMAASLVALIYGKMCIGSFTYHLLRGDAAFAFRTLPWVTRAESSDRPRGAVETPSADACA
jgi:hypothetical protein